MKIAIHTNLDLIPANQSALKKLEESLDGFAVIPQIDSSLMLDNISVRVCGIRFKLEKQYHKPRNEDGYHTEKLHCCIEVNVPKGWTITRFYELQAR